MKRFFLFRHGETDWNQQGRFQGHMDIPLNEKGRKDALRLTAPVARLGIQLIVSSDLNRAKETADIIAAGKIEVRADPRLREGFLGDAQGATFEELRNRYPLVIDRWRSPFLQDADASYPGGETGEQIFERSFACLEEIARTVSQNHIGISTHGGVLRRLFQIKFLKDSVIPIPNGILYMVEFDPKEGAWHFPGYTPLR